MLEYRNLSPLEFEYVCQDIMQAMLQIPLRRFAPGKDGGIDLVDDLSNPAAVATADKRDLPDLCRLHAVRTKYRLPIGDRPLFMRSTKQRAAAQTFQALALGDQYLIRAVQPRHLCGFPDAPL